MTNHGSPSQPIEQEALSLMCPALAPEMPPIPERPDHIDRDMWHAAHARYRVAAATYSRFQATRYRPAVAAMDGCGLGKRLWPCWRTTRQLGSRGSAGHQGSGS